MTKQQMLEILENAPVIAAVKDEAGLTACLAGEAAVVFILYGTVVDIAQTVQRVRDAGKIAIVHIDLIDGLSAREMAVDYIAGTSAAQGIISTKSALVKRARELGLLAIRRFFLLDSMALRNIEKQMDSAADFVEVLPGVMPKVLRKIALGTPLPMIAGGLIADKEDVVNALSAGAVAVSSTNPAVWGL